MSDQDIERLKKAKDNAYWERNQLVAALSKVFPSHLAKHPEEDIEWEDDWRTIVVIWLPTDYDGGKTTDPRNMYVKLEDGKWYTQLTWHIHDSEVPFFDHLTYVPLTKQDYRWDGHTTEEKYRRLRTLSPEK